MDMLHDASDDAGSSSELEYGIQEVPFPEEVKSVVEDVRFAVNEISVSTVYPPTAISAHLNIVTKEDRVLFVVMSPQGFRIIGNARDTKNELEGPTYETIQALLDRESPEYRRLFSEAVSKKLEAFNENMVDRNSAGVIP